MRVIKWEALAWIAWCLFMIYVVPTTSTNAWANPVLWICVAFYAAWFVFSVWRAFSATSTQEKS